jgi:PhoD related phosphatase
MSIRTLDSIDPNQASSKSQSSKLTNGATSASSRTRRQVADINLSDYTDDDRIHPPAVPEVPRGPPLSYRQPYEGESLNQQPRRSFSQRAKGHMLAREALEDNHYWDDNDTTPLQLSIPEAPRKSIGRNDANSSLQNGFKNTERERTVRRGSSERQPPGTSQDNSITPKTPQDLASSVRHAADVQPLNLDLPSPSTQINAVKGSKNQIESQRKEWANDRSPLQTLEVKLNDISKEEKRARVEEAEMLLRESKAGRGGHRSSREASAATKGSPLTKEPPPEPNGVDRARVDRSSSTAQRDVVQSKAPVELQKPSKRPSAGKPARRFDDQENLVTGRTANVEVLPANQPRSLPQSSRDVGQTHPAHGSQKAMSSDKPRQASFQESAKIDVVHPAHDRDPRTGNATGRAPDESALYADQRNGRLQNEVRRATSARQAPMAQSIPSNITRAVSLQQHQNQPLYSGDQETARSGPMRESNSSHKAALADTSTATGAGGAIAATSLKRDNSRKLKKLPSTNVNQNFQPEAKGLPDSMHSGLTSVPLSANVGDTKVELYYKGMPRQVDVQRPSSQRAPEPASLGLKKPATTEQSPTANKPRRASVSFKVPSDRTRPVNEWKQAGTARLTLADLTIEVPNEGDQAWWEMNGSSSRRRSKGSSGNIQKSDAYSQQESVKPMEFKPPLYLKCGPLLRYTGMRRDRAEPQPGQTVSAIRRETWRGSVMIVTNDSQSTYEDGPTLRIFSQPRDLLPPPPDQVEGDDLAPEYVDPIAGLTKVSRRGQTLYVKPVDHLEEGKDLSRIENDDGLFETSPSPLDNTHGSTTANKRTRGRDGESIGKYKEVKGCRLHADTERGVTFWRFNIEVELSDQQAHIAYRINHGPAVGFWVPAKGQSMNIMFHSCNGFSLTVNSDQFGGPDPLWRDVLNTHQTRPFHVMIGGGDQIYNDRVMIDTNHFAAWTHLRNPHEKHHAPFTDEMREELESFYLNRYAMWFSQGLFGLANSQIPMVNIYDDHDIIDGFGSYPDDFQKAPVFMGVGNIAFKYYMLFQHQSVPEETQADEPCWLLGARPGPYIQQRSRSVFLNLGRSVAFLGLDCRTEREVSFRLCAFD